MRLKGVKSEQKVLSGKHLQLRQKGTGSMNKNTYAQRLQAGREKYYRMAWCYVKNEHEALDIVGEAAYKGLMKLHSLKNPEFFDTWMTRIVINAALDYLRKSKRTDPYDDEVLSVIPASENGPAVEDTLDLYAALDCLSERDKTCIVLKYFEEYTFAEIAKMTEETEAAVKSRIYRSLAKMRGYLQKGAEKS